jgi:hypothetical protein
MFDRGRVAYVHNEALVKKYLTGLTGSRGFVFGFSPFEAVFNTSLVLTDHSALPQYA